MPSEEKQWSKFLEFALILVAAYLLSRLLFQVFVPSQTPEKRDGGVSLRAVDATVRGGHHPVLLLRNGTEKDVSLPDRCPMPPVDVFLVQESGERRPLLTEDTVLPCGPVQVVPPGGEVKIDLAPWKYSLFSQYGAYEVRLSLPVEGGGGDIEKTQIETSFSLYEPGFVVKLFRAFITKPFLNFLILTASVLPNHSLGVGIILLTLLVKFCLYFPAQKALEGQRELQKLQPKLEELKKKHGGDAKRIQEETVRLWKEHRVNPFSSCLPMVFQFPILIGLFFVIRDGAVLALSRHLLYPMYQDLPWTFGTNFLGLDLTKPNVMVMPAVLALLQFTQMKLSMIQQKSKAEGKPKGAKSPQEIQQQIMLYAMPLMIGFFAVKFPAAVSLYWGVSTSFAVGQQVLVNRKANARTGG